MSSSSFAAPGTHLQELVVATATSEQKIACLKTLRIVVKNLADPVKSKDTKFRQLKLSNEKVKAKITPCPSAIDYMKAIGFSQVTDSDGEEYLRIDAKKTIDISHMQSSLVELNNALEMLTPKDVNPSFTEEKKTSDGILPSKRTQPTSTSYSTTTTEKLSEKQKARLLMEEKERKEKEAAKAARKKTAALIKADKYVRENDENWESKQSAACVKSGTGISTFRDKYGEN
mmetsp:Transcript_3691/g.6105  ORF Transcript_3691/g.6105 Transcript_3691/m.6105 type:complete len:230 (+) Transcript_3691:102-791(+)